MQRRGLPLTLTTRVTLFAFLFLTFPLFADNEYPADFKPSKPAATGETNVLARFGAVTTYMNDKLNAAGGEKSPQCYRNCLTVGVNDVLKCIEIKNTYASSEACEKDGAQKMSLCDPKCQ
jgi:hypothetical protein